MIKMTCKSKEQKTGWGIVNAMGRWEVGKIASNWKDELSQEKEWGKEEWLGFKSIEFSFNAAVLSLEPGLGHTSAGERPWGPDLGFKLWNISMISVSLCGPPPVEVS